MTAAAIPLLLAASVGTSAYFGHVQAKEGRQQVRDARAERKKVEARELAKAALLKQGIQEQATELETKDPFSDTGGVPLSVKRRLTIGGSAANV